MSGKARFAAIAAKVAASVCLVMALSATAHAGATKVFGSQWAWDNNFNNSNIGVSFGTGSTPSLTVTFDFTSFNLYGYPACIHGWHYGYNPANDNKYPAQIKNIGSDGCSFSYNWNASSLYGDFAYDMFLRSDSSKSSPELEVMIWATNNSWPIGGKVRSGTVNGQDLWMGYNGAAGYETFSFVPAGAGGGNALSKTGSGSYNASVGTYLNYLCSNYGSYVNTSWYLDVVEMGMEITEGNGSVTLKGSN